ENVDYSSWSIKSLKKLAQAFDVVLTVRFERFKNLALDAERFGRKNLEVPKFKDDPFFAGVQELRPLQTPLSPQLFIATPPDEPQEDLVTIGHLLHSEETAKTRNFQMTT
ncbi:MAG: hypothetical protein WBE87_04520, partial [Candidatus Acidiferrales bacterium]